MDEQSTDGAAPKKGFTFVPTVTLGNILSGAIVFSSVVLWGARLEGRVTAVETLREEVQRDNDRRFSAIEAESQKQMQQVQRDADKTDQTRRSEMRDIKDTLGRIELKIDTKADKK